MAVGHGGCGARKFSSYTLCANSTLRRSSARSSTVPSASPPFPVAARTIPTTVRLVSPGLILKGPVAMRYLISSGFVPGPSCPPRPW